jgi:hypothetical protein
VTTWHGSLVPNCYNDKYKQRPTLGRKSLGNGWSVDHVQLPVEVGPLLFDIAKLLAAEQDRNLSFGGSTWTCSWEDTNINRFVCCAI